ncbi:hypothetical protein SKAU_G00400250 [Synaphobranchus kaupii]|uniref:Pentraxin (PTX) domain-containing protein n=1 Tax=Synaphobranchus kaupii TaxID=118154 RepID=A0A9Q1E8Z4_SYNKA|nr:hypothetical protein SKAU_G00400250 [Synaphobranchus kaupii]
MRLIWQQCCFLDNHASVSRKSPFGRAASSLPGMEYDYGQHPRMVCTPIPASADPDCFSGHESDDRGHHRPSGGGSPAGHGWRGLTDEAKTTVLHLRESLVQQKETILDQRETIRELTARLTLCEGFGRSAGGHGDRRGQHHAHHPPPLHHPHPDPGRHADPHYPLVGLRSGLHHRGKGTLGGGDNHSGPASPEQVGRMLQALKERLENLQSRNSSSSYSNSLRDLLRRKINALEQQLRHHPALRDNGDHHDDHHDDEDHDHDHDRDGHHGHDHDRDHRGRHREYSRRENHYLDHHYDDHHGDDHHDNEADGHGQSPRKAYHGLGYRTTSHGPHTSKLDLVLSQLHHRSADSGQANELVLIEWGNNPMELLVNDQAVSLPLSLSDGKWHHLCVTWSTRDGLWEAYQDGVKRGSGENLSTWHHIKPGGVIILGQEQDTLGGRFDVTQAFMGEISDLQLWSHVLTSQEIYNLGTCGSHMTGDIISWTESVVELHGGVTKYPFEPCH